jgi:hypothetical protein
VSINEGQALLRTEDHTLQGMQAKEAAKVSDGRNQPLAGLLQRECRRQKQQQDTNIL